VARPTLLVVLACVVTVLTPACSDRAVPTSRRSPVTIRVPADHRTIQAAVDAARAGDLILVSAGTYHGSVTVETPRLTIRGVDRNAVVLDGRDRDENGVMVLADGVAVENLTVHHYRSNGVLFTGDYGKGQALVGYRAAYVTAYDNGLYGVYAFNARGGSIDHVYASGHPDSGIYVGQCFPCDAVVSRSVAEHNAVGYQGTNSGGNLLVVSSTWQDNRVGVEPTSSVKERMAPEKQTTIVGNVIRDNNDAQAPKATEAFGIGVVVGGGHGNLIERNLVTGNRTAGILLSPQETFLPEDNQVRGNHLSDNGVDLVAVLTATRPSGNCFEANVFTTSAPPDIQTLLACRPEAQGGAATAPTPIAPAGPDYRTIPAPPPQEQMPDATTAPVSHPGAAPPKVDLDAITVPV